MTKTQTASMHIWTRESCFKAGLIYPLNLLKNKIPLVELTEQRKIHLLYINENS